jgi:DNA-binding response OmpR family regulator
MSRRATVLLVEDDPAAALLLVGLLEARNYSVFQAASGREARRLLDAVRADVLIVDLMAGGLDYPGLFTDPQRIPSIPIIVPRAGQGAEETILELRVDAHGIALYPSADDELAERVADLLRSKPRAVQADPRRSEYVQVGQLLVDRSHRRATVNGQSLQLTPTEYWLLVALAQRPGQTVTRDELALEISERRSARERTLTVHMARLRAKLVRGGPGSPGLKAVRGRGYMLVSRPAGHGGRDGVAEDK